MKELLEQQYKQTKNRCEIDQTYLKPGEVAIVDASNEQNGGDGGEWSESRFCEVGKCFVKVDDFFMCFWVRDAWFKYNLSPCMDTCMIVCKPQKTT